MFGLEKLIDYLKREGYLIDPRLEAAIRKVPIEKFVPQIHLPAFLRDEPIEFYPGRTTAAPHMICIMIQELELADGMKVLVLGAKSGYLEALISEMVGKDGFVYVLDSNLEICSITEENLLNAGYERQTSCLVRDPLEGYPSKGPWDRILVTCQVPDIPEGLKEQLTDGGFIIAPIGPEAKTEKDVQEFTKIQRIGNEFKEIPLGSVRFGPLESQSRIKIKHVRKVPSAGTDMINYFLKIIRTDLIKTLRKEFRASVGAFERIHTEIEAVRAGVEAVRKILMGLHSRFLEIKRSTSNLEVKLPRLYELLTEWEKFVPKESLETVEAKLRGEIKNWDRLEHHSKLFLATAEYLLSLGEEDQDFSPIALEFCKAMENEVNVKIFDRFKAKLGEEFPKVPSEDACWEKDFGKNFLAYLRGGQTGNGTVGNGQNS